MKTVLYADSDDRIVDILADQLLYDIQVELDYEYADSTRELFPFFQPVYRRSPDLLLQDRMRKCYGALTDKTKHHVRRAIIESCRRCAMHWLGLWRSLEVLDLALFVAPESLSSATVSGLLRLKDPADAGVRGEWLVLLIRRWADNRLFPEVDHSLWFEAMKDVRPGALLAVTGYIVRGPLRGQPEIADCIQLAHHLLLERQAEALPEALGALLELSKDVLPEERFEFPLYVPGLNPIFRGQEVLAKLSEELLNQDQLIATGKDDWVLSDDGLKDLGFVDYPAMGYVQAH